MNALDDLFTRLSAGERLALARLLSYVERDRPEAEEVLRRAFARAGRARWVGFTGPAGVGKSTLVNRFLEHVRARGERVGVVAIDPTSPFTGGAVLGDRLRMQAHATDPGVFIRSLASRDGRGGVCGAALGAARLMDAFGFDWVIIETIGVGQDEVDIGRIAACVVMVHDPSAGDGVQIMKAGLMEIGDIILLNKCDRHPTDGAKAEIEAQLRHLAARAWRVPVLPVSGASGDGLPAAFAALDRFFAEGAHADPDRAADRAAYELRELTEAAFWRRARAALGERLPDAVRRLAARQSDPFTLRDEILEAATE